MEPGSWCQAQPQRPIEGMGRLSHCGPLCEVTIVSLSSWGEMHILTIFIIYLIEQKNFSEEMGLCCLRPLNSWCPGKSSLDRLKDFLPQVEVTHRTARGLCGDHGGQFTATPFPAPSHRSQGTSFPVSWPCIPGSSASHTPSSLRDFPGKMSPQEAVSLIAVRGTAAPCEWRAARLGDKRDLLKEWPLFAQELPQRGRRSNGRPGSLSETS